jgi:uncharacterized Fe-S radical SAM superfamily protein PflX
MAAALSLARTGAASPRQSVIPRAQIILRAMTTPSFVLHCGKSVVRYIAENRGGTKGVPAAA